MAYICRTVSAPTTDITISSEATTTVILVRIESLASMMDISSV